jgi:hypothetical protein
MLKRSRRYSYVGYGGNGVNGRTACRQVGWQQCVNNDDFLGDKDDRQRRVDGILLPPAMLLRRIGGRLPQTGTKHGSGGASEDDHVEDDADGLGG